MKNTQKMTFQNATGKIDYTLMNDCMFHTVMQANQKVLKGLVCSLLHLEPDEVQSATILNTLEFGEKIRDKTRKSILRIIIHFDV